MNLEQAWPDAAAAWAEYRPTPQEPWDEARVIHLHKRAGFGASWTKIRRDAADGFERSIARVLDGDPESPDGRPADAVREIAQTLAESAGRDDTIDRVQLAWVYRMLYSAHPLAERMLLAWHDHYACSLEKVYEAPRMVAQHQTLRRLWRGRARELHRAMLADYALQQWLDNTESRKEHPNENLAREFLELFSLGEGNYTERDVKEVARALTGWEPTLLDRAALRFSPEQFGNGRKTILGTTGRWGLEDVARLVTAQPAAAVHLARLLYRTFVSDTDRPSDGFLAPLARAMRTADGDLDITAGIATVIRSRVFHSPVCRGKRVKGPADFVIGSLRSCGLLRPPLELGEVNRHLSVMGLKLFYAPSIAGWPRGTAWLTPSGLIARANFAAQFGSESLAEGGSSDYGRVLAEELGRQGMQRPEDQEKALAGLLLGAALGPDCPGTGASAAGNPLAVARRLLSLPQAHLC
jgi:uncharacterized protein (DUF1800 family)